MPWRSRAKRAPNKAVFARFIGPAPSNAVQQVLLRAPVQAAPAAPAAESKSSPTCVRPQRAARRIAPHRPASGPSSRIRRDASTHWFAR